MDATLDLLTLLVFLAVLLAYFAARSLNGRRQKDKDAALHLALLKTRLNAGESDKAAAALTSTKAQDILREMERVPFARLPVFGKSLGKIWFNLSVLGWQKTLRTRLTMLTLASLLPATLLGREMPMPWVSVSVLAVLCFALLANISYRNALAKHLKQLKQSLPEAIDAITRTARAGVPITNAFALVAENIPGPLAVEFSLIDNWMRLGLPLRQAMQDSAKRIPLNEYRFFAVILIINQEAGGRLGETLDRLASTLRERQELQLKIQAKTSEARASAKIVASLVPMALGYMYLNSPNDFRFLLNDPTGNSVLFYAFGSVTLGLLITQQMVRRVV
ncbi:hypothetical protein AUC61_19935 [Pseudomonas sp. S25]|uniref:Type II secretion system protein GspF domain-containing protein n=1 Tax=Pseudomonas maioricensis TaxID=1766623 RepID=A0ABS9ZND7_9PSED|nr:type II secretion system F family protein [Pseudomonas sp. S25]MCI8211807.1 hypothetical protein [Pseudomonas sp. S25]